MLDLRKLERLRAKAERASGKHWKRGLKWHFVVDEDDGIHVVHSHLYAGDYFVADGSNQYRWPIFEYAAAACNAVPQLIARIRELEEEREHNGLERDLCQE